MIKLHQWKEISTVITQQEKLYFDINKAMKSKFFKRKNVRSKFKILLYKEFTLKIHDN